MDNKELALDGRLSPDGRHLTISRGVRFRVDPSYYRANGLGEIGLMPTGMEFSEDRSGIEEIVTEHLGVETFGGLTLRSSDGDLGPVDLRFVSRITRAGQEYVLRRAPYKKEDIFALYIVGSAIACSTTICSTGTPGLAGMGVCNFEEERIAKLMGLGIYDRFRDGGHGTALLAGIEKECAKTNILLLLHNPLKQAIPFYTRRGYRLLEHPNGPDFAKALNPGFDERLLMPPEEEHAKRATPNPFKSPGVLYRHGPLRL